jgi:phage terminase large subunit-like protein
LAVIVSRGNAKTEVAGTIRRTAMFREDNQEEKTHE